MKTGKLILGVLAGIAAGATLGILFAPDKGSSTRRKIYQKGDNFVDGLEENFNEFVEGVGQKFEKIRTEATSIVEDAKSKVDDYVAKASDSSSTQTPKNQL
jgi:gas vesicle protein